MAIRFDEADARAMGRNTRGVKGINLQDDDEVVGMVVADPQGYLLTVCENGYGKRTPFGANIAGVEEEVPEKPMDAGQELPEGAPVAVGPSPSDTAGEAPPQGEEGTADAEGSTDKSSMRYRKQRRGGKGLRDIRTSERNGPVVQIISVRDGDDIMLITAQGMVNRTHVSEIRVVGRNTQGVRVMNLNEGDRIASVAKVAKDDIDAEATADQPVQEQGTPEEPTAGDRG
jgi:DNA gyrase subunit A